MTVTALASIVQLAMSKSDEQRAWISKLIDHFRVNVTQLATQSGVVPSTISKFMAGVRPGHTLSTATIDRIERKFGVRYPNDPKAVAPGGLAEPEAVEFDVRMASPDIAVTAARALCAGHNSRVPWQIRAPVLQDIGVMPGDILVVDLNEAPKEGDIVCAQSYRKDGSVETVFRIFRQPFFLVGAGPGARLPLVADDRSAQVRGVVIGSFRPRGIAAAVA
jgi:hypothetical protein